LGFALAGFFADELVFGLLGDLALGAGFALDEEVGLRVADFAFAFVGADLDWVVLFAFGAGFALDEEAGLRLVVLGFALGFAFVGLTVGDLEAVEIDLAFALGAVFFCKVVPVLLDFVLVVFAFAFVGFFTTSSFDFVESPLVWDRFSCCSILANNSSSSIVP
jgi:thiamine transporter ThiT